RYEVAKPYYTVDGGDLVQHNAPVPMASRPVGLAGTIKSIADHSFMVHRILAASLPGIWYASQQTFVKVANDPPEITCRLLQRLKARTEALGIRTLLVIQYGAGIIRLLDGPPGEAMIVTSCAVAMGIQIVDEFESIKAIYRANPDKLRSYYVMHGDEFG